MLARFCLYGFLKNQQYYAPFIVLAFRDKGLSFFLIGLLVAVREIATNLLEIPSGAVADLYGRRRSMIVSFSGYILSFALLDQATSFAGLAGAMVLFGVGDAFRTGTHKAMIQEWLEREGRAAERTQVYGLTRSWSRVGSGVSALLAGFLVYYAGDYRTIFRWSIVPYVLGVVNFLGYPSWLDGSSAEAPSPGAVWRHLRDSIRSTLGPGPLRRLMGETMAGDGVYDAVKDYLQPVLKTAALGLPILVADDPVRRSALVIGCVYAGLHLMESRASRRAGGLAERCGGDEAAAALVWRWWLAVYVALFVALAAGLSWLPVALFVVLGLLHNLWRPFQVGRIQAAADPRQRATVLSVESQTKTVATTLAAPVVGWLVDHVSLACVPALGALAALLVILRRPAAAR